MSGTNDGKGDGGGGLYEGKTDSDGGFRLRGVPRRALVGFLTLFGDSSFSDMKSGDNRGAAISTISVLVDGTVSVKVGSTRSPTSA